MRLKTRTFHITPSRIIICFVYCFFDGFYTHADHYFFQRGASSAEGTIFSSIKFGYFLRNAEPKYEYKNVLYFDMDRVNDPTVIDVWSMKLSTRSTKRLWSNVTFVQGYKQYMIVTPKKLFPLFT